MAEPVRTGSDRRFSSVRFGSLLAGSGRFNRFNPKLLISAPSGRFPARFRCRSTRNHVGFNYRASGLVESAPMAADRSFSPAASPPSIRRIPAVSPADTGLKRTGSSPRSRRCPPIASSCRGSPVPAPFSPRLSLPPFALFRSPWVRVAGANGFVGLPSCSSAHRRRP